MIKQTLTALAVAAFVSGVAVANEPTKDACDAAILAAEKNLADVKDEAMKHEMEANIAHAKEAHAKSDFAGCVKSLETKADEKKAEKKAEEKK